MDEEQKGFSLAVYPRRHAITQQTPVPRKTVEPLSEGGTGSQGVLDQVERATGQRLGEMDAERFVARQARGKAPRHVGHGLRDANGWVHEPRPPEELTNRRGVNTAALNPCYEVGEYPALNRRHDGRACV